MLSADRHEVTQLHCMLGSNLLLQCVELMPWRATPAAMMHHQCLAAIKAYAAAPAVVFLAVAVVSWTAGSAS